MNKENKETIKDFLQNMASQEDGMFVDNEKMLSHVPFIMEFMRDRQEFLI